MSSDERLKKAADPARQSRAELSRSAKESRELSDDDRIEMFRQQFFQSALPDLPKIPDYHTCWLTTTNPRDTVHARMRLGYEQVKPSDVPGWDYATVKTGEYAGMIGVNEMLAFKIPMRLYNTYMEEAHFNAPLREDEKLQSMVDQISDGIQRSGGRVIEGDGMQALREAPGKAVFSD